ncbi:MAG TPA: YopX family protein [Bacteroidia bacterium]
MSKENQNNIPSIFSQVFTGMHDKNGDPIHEGDQVKLYYKGNYVICQVVYDTKHAAFLLKWPDGYINQYFMNGSSYEVVKQFNP